MATRQLTAALRSTAVILATTGPAAAGELGPARVVDVLRTQPSIHYDFVVTFAAGQTPDAELSQRSGAYLVPLINSLTLNLPVSEAFELAKRPDVVWVWYLHPDVAGITIRTLRALDAAVAGGSTFANLSLGPPRAFYVTAPDKDDPMLRALAAAAHHGVTPVVAVGNVGGLTPGYVNPWSTLDEVISVGAWDHTTNAVWSESSTALPDQMDAWPDVVAPGVDVISAWPTYLQKTPERKAKDEANERFRQTVPKESWDTHTMMSGTSQAAAIVTGSATQVFRFVYGVIESQDKQPGDKLFSLEGGPDRISDYDRLVPRLTGTAEPSANGGMIYTYEFDHPWKVVKQILIDTAQPIEGAKPWQAGAGLVSPDYIREQFGAFGIEPPTIVPYKVE